MNQLKDAYEKLNTEEIVHDLLKNGMMLVGYHLLVRNEPKWWLSVLFVLLGFLAYHLTVDKVLDVVLGKLPSQVHVFQDAIKTAFKFMVMFLVSRLGRGQGPLTLAWVTRSVLLMSGWVLYELVVKRYASGSSITSNATLARTYDDVLALTLASALPAAVMGKSLLSMNFLLGIVGGAMGLLAYNYGMKKYMDARGVVDNTSGDGSVPNGVERGSADKEVVLA